MEPFDYRRHFETGDLSDPRISTHRREQITREDKAMHEMIFRSYWLDRRDQYAKAPHWVKVRVLYGAGGTLLYVLDSERGVYPVRPNDLKNESELPKVARQGMADEKRYAYMLSAKRWV